MQDGELPLWNPYIYCGHPFAANIQTALFYPPRLAATLLGGVSAKTMLRSLELELILHVFLAGAFCFLLITELGLNRAVAFAGATSFQLGSFFASQAEHLGAIEAAAWLPLIWLLLLRLAKLFRFRDALLLSGALSMSLLCGFTPMTAVTLLSSALLILLLIFTRKATPKLALIFSACFAATLLLCSAAFFPAVQLTLLSVSRFRSDWIGKGGGLPLASLQSILWPNAFHVLERGAYKGPPDITLMYLYSGMVMVCGCIALTLKRKPAGSLLFASLFLLSALFMLGESTPFGTLYASIFPVAVRGVIYPQYWIAPFSLAFCTLGSLGIAGLPQRTWLVPTLALIAACDLTWFGSNRPFNTTTLAAEPGITETAFAGNTALLDTVRRFSNLTTPPSRIDTLNDSIDWVGSAMITDLPTAGGEDPLALIRYIQARLAVSQGERWGYYYQVDRLDSPVLPSLNVCCVVSRSRIPPDQLARSSYSSTLEIPGGFLYYSGSALPRFHLVHQTIPAANLSEAAALAKRPEWRPQDIAIVEGFSAGPTPTDTSTDHVSITSYRRNSVRLQTQSSSSSFLVSSESNFPGWKARIDGQYAPIYNTNVAFRGLPLPPGRHIVEFIFEPMLLFVSLVISLTAWATYFVLLLRSSSYSALPDRRPSLKLAPFLPNPTSSASEKM